MIQSEYNRDTKITARITAEQAESQGVLLPHGFTFENVPRKRGYGQFYTDLHSQKLMQDAIFKGKLLLGMNLLNFMLRKTDYETGLCSLIKPHRAQFCREIEVSEKTLKRALEHLRADDIIRLVQWGGVYMLNPTILYLGKHNDKATKNYYDTPDISNKKLLTQLTARVEYKENGRVKKK